MNIPYKCPVCEGLGRLRSTVAAPLAHANAQAIAYIDCHACNGTGIVWHEKRDTFKGVDIPVESGVNVHVEEYGRTTTMDGFDV